VIEADIVLYSDGGQESERAEALLKTDALRYKKYVLGKDFSKTEFEMEFGGDAHYPQLNVGTKHVGGLKEFLQHLYM
jgi:hypothetical protein|tara:strand:- start:1758 stop:1988 length:231 start_codon:yes stop_codon:yes gene_type:complete